MNLKSFEKDNSTEIPRKLSEELIVNKKETVKENTTNKSVFWTENDGKISIRHTELLEFLSDSGFAKVIYDKNVIFVRESNKRVREITENDIISFIQKYLNENKLKAVYEKFGASVSSYINPKKLYLLKEINMVSDRDDYYSSRIFFKNCFCEVFEDKFKVKDYHELSKNIWENRIIDREFRESDSVDSGQFEKFIFNLSKRDEHRFKALQSIIGYLLHRNKERGEPLAIILYDEQMINSNEANGRTGKTLISKALKEIRELVTFDGKNLKKGSWFKNQRITIRTDIMNYDDLDRNYNLEECYPILTTGIEIEKKRQDSIFIPFLQSPKVLLSSNFYISGPLGASDRARRHEFEVANYFNDVKTPESEFGNRFFGREWDLLEWNKFYKFMMNCISVYLRNGLIEAKPINLNSEKGARYTSPDFYKYIVDKLTFNVFVDKREFIADFKFKYPTTEDLSSHQFTKWLKEYATIIKASYEDKSSGGEYLFKISKTDNDEE